MLTMTDESRIINKSIIDDIVDYKAGTERMTRIFPMVATSTRRTTAACKREMWSFQLALQIYITHAGWLSNRVFSHASSSTLYTGQWVSCWGVVSD